MKATRFARWSIAAISRSGSCSGSTRTCASRHPPLRGTLSRKRERDLNASALDRKRVILSRADGEGSRACSRRGSFALSGAQDDTALGLRSDHPSHPQRVRPPTLHPSFDRFTPADLAAEHGAAKLRHLIIGAKAQADKLVGRQLADAGQKIRRQQLLQAQRFL